MKVYKGTYDIDMSVVAASNVELVVMTVPELDELLEIIGTLKQSPTLREVVQGAQATLEVMKTGVDWDDLGEDQRFNALTFRAAMRAYEKKNMAAIKDATG